MHSYKNNISLRKESNMGIASLVLGIASLVCGCFLPGLQWIGSITGLIGIILGALGRKNSEKKRHCNRRIGLFNHRFCAVYNFLRSLRSLRIDRVKSSQWSQLIPTAKYW